MQHQLLRLSFLQDQFLRPPFFDSCPCIRPPFFYSCPCLRPPFFGLCPCIRPPFLDVPRHTPTSIYWECILHSAHTQSISACDCYHTQFFFIWGNTLIGVLFVGNHLKINMFRPNTLNQIKKRTKVKPSEAHRSNPGKHTGQTPCEIHKSREMHGSNPGKYAGQTPGNTGPTHRNSTWCNHYDLLYADTHTCYHYDKCVLITFPKNSKISVYLEL